MRSPIIGLTVLVVLLIVAMPNVLGATCNDFTYRKEINITNDNTTVAMPSGQIVFDVIDTTGDNFQDNGDDLRVFYQGTTELDRINLTDFNSTTTRLYFALQSSISASSSDSDYFLCYGNVTATSPLDDSVIFNFSDTFDTGINTTTWYKGAYWDWNNTGYAHGDYGGSGISNEFVTNATFGNMTVIIYRFNLPTRGADTFGAIHELFSGANNCSQSRFSSQSDFMSITISGYPAKIHPITINDNTWYWAMAKVGEGLVNNELWLDWNQEIVNETGDCNAMTSGSRGWSVGEDADQELKIDDVYIYNYFYPEPTITLGAEINTSIPPNITISVPTPGQQYTTASSGISTVPVAVSMSVVNQTSLTSCLYNYNGGTNTSFDCSSFSSDVSVGSNTLNIYIEDEKLLSTESVTFSVAKMTAMTDIPILAVIPIAIVAVLLISFVGMITSGILDVRLLITVSIAAIVAIIMVGVLYVV